jgi:TrmH family RNA methyltransferase
MTETLASEKNPLLKDVRRAATRGSLTADGFAVAEGAHLFKEALAAGLEIGAVILTEAAQGAWNGASRLSTKTRVVVVPDTVFSSLSSTETPQGIMALVRPPVWALEHVLRGTPLVVILDGVQDPGNAGAIVRAAEAFGATGLAFLKGAASPHNPKCLRASAGSIFRVPWVAGLEGELVLDAMAGAGIALYAAMPRAKRLASQVDLTAGCAIVIGAEGAGVQPALAARATGVRIPTSGVESLNAAVAAGVLLYEARRQRSSM